MACEQSKVGLDQFFQCLHYLISDTLIYLILYRVYLRIRTKIRCYHLRNDLRFMFLNFNARIKSYPSYFTLCLPTLYDEPWPMKCEVSPAPALFIHFSFLHIPIHSLTRGWSGVVRQRLGIMYGIERHEMQTQPPLPSFP